VKKFFLFFALVSVSVSITGCAPKTTRTFNDYAWPVILIMQFELREVTVEQNAISSLKELINNENVIHEQNILQVGLVFDNYDKFAEYFGINPNAYKSIDTQIVKSTFFYERTITFKNPWNTVLGHARNKITSIHLAVTSLFNLKNPSADPGYIYVLSSSFRRTKVDNTIGREQNGRTFDYVFMYGGQNGTDEIVIFDRFANTPIWYGSALFACGIFIACAYVTFLKNCNRGKSAVTEQSPQTSDYKNE
jgi:hypothetical protein